MTKRSTMQIVMALMPFVPLALSALEIDDYDKASLESLFSSEAGRENSFSVYINNDIEPMESSIFNLQEDFESPREEAFEEFCESAETSLLSLAWGYGYLCSNYSDICINSLSTGLLLPPIKKTSDTSVAEKNILLACSHAGCNYSTDKGINLRAHLSRHKRKGRFICLHTGCGKFYSSRDSFRVHMKRDHMGKEPFSCDHLGCNYSNGSKSNLTQHKIKHENGAFFKCKFPDCDKFYSKSYNLARHVKDKHTQGK